MSDDPKYVVFDSDLAGMYAVIFPPVASHADVGRNLRLGTPLSAGFFSIAEDGAMAYGESESLKLKSDQKRDSRLLNQALRLGEYKD